MTEEQIEARVKTYVAALPGTLLEDKPTQDEISTATDIYRDGLKDGLEMAQKQQVGGKDLDDLLKLCKMLPSNIDLENPDAADFKDNANAFINAMTFARHILGEIAETPT